MSNNLVKGFFLVSLIFLIACVAHNQAGIPDPIDAGQPEQLFEEPDLSNATLVREEEYYHDLFMRHTYLSREEGGDQPLIKVRIEEFDRGGKNGKKDGIIDVKKLFFCFPEYKQTDRYGNRVFMPAHTDIHLSIDDDFDGVPDRVLQDVRNKKKKAPGHDGIYDKEIRLRKQ